jgi:hypothetical protein
MVTWRCLSRYAVPLMIVTLTIGLFGCDAARSFNKGVSRDLNNAGDFKYEDQKGHDVQDAVRQSNTR